VYLANKERIWWLQMLFFLAGGATMLPNPLEGFEGPLRGGGERGREGKGRKGGRKHPLP